MTGVQTCALPISGILDLLALVVPDRCHFIVAHGVVGVLTHLELIIWTAGDTVPASVAFVGVYGDVELDRKSVV